MSKHKDKPGEPGEQAVERQASRAATANGWRLMVITLSVVLVGLCFEVHRLRTDVHVIARQQELLTEIRDLMQHQQTMRQEDVKEPVATAGARAVKRTGAVASADERTVVEPTAQPEATPEATPDAVRVEPAEMRSPSSTSPSTSPSSFAAEERVTPSSSAKSTTRPKASTAVKATAGVLPPAWTGPSLIDCANKLDFENIRKRFEHSARFGGQDISAGDEGAVWLTLSLAVNIVPALSSALSARLPSLVLPWSRSLQLFYPPPSALTPSTFPCIIIHSHPPSHNHGCAVALEQKVARGTYPSGLHALEAQVAQIHEEEVRTHCTVGCGC